jgi:urea transporter
MKSIVMAAWLSTVAIGNAFVSIMAQIEAPSRAIDFFLFASLMILASSVFAFLLQFYTYRVPDDEELNGRADSDGTMPQLSVTEDNDTAEEY